MDLPSLPNRSPPTLLLVEWLMHQVSMQVGIRQRNPLEQRRSRDNEYMIKEFTVVTNFSNIPALSSNQHFCIWEYSGFWKPKCKTDSSLHHSQCLTSAMCASNLHSLRPYGEGNPVSLWESVFSRESMKISLNWKIQMQPSLFEFS